VKVAFNRRLLVVWLILAAFTLAYLVIDRSAGQHGGALRPSVVATSSMIVIALIKVRIIFREFMEVRQAPALLRALTDAWVLLIGVSLFACYIVGMTLR
jgi:hypothetical protein